MYKEEEKTMGPIRAFAQRACERAQPGSPLALLQERPSHWGESAAALSQNMIDEAITLLFAGQDTSAATLSWTLHLLSLYPNVQERLAEEVRFVLYESNGSNTTEPSREASQGTSFTKKTVSKMPFLDAVIKESMRLYPVAPFVVRKLQHDVNVVEGTQLPSGAFCCIWIYGLHRNPQLWRRPNDFVPDRWIDASLRDAGQEMMGAYMPFAMGPRSCLGQPLANVILRIVLARIIHQYQFADPRLSGSQCDASKLRKDMQAGFTVLPAGGLKLSVTARANVMLRTESGNNDEDK
jgi:cytochrome P450